MRDGSRFTVIPSSRENPECGDGRGGARLLVRATAPGQTTAEKGDDDIQST